MSLLSLQFLLFSLLVVLAYFVVPKRYQWWVLLIASLYFYSLTGLKNLLYIGITSFSTYLATTRIQKNADEQKSWIKENKKTASRDEKAAYKAAMKRIRKRYLIGTLILNFGIMCTFKYIHFALEQINAIIGIFNGTPVRDTLQFIIPLGISFYTFQTMGYLIDVYWGKVTAEKNYAKVLLFVSFFPQMTQGPISDFKALTDELFCEHTFDYHAYVWGLERMIWGFFKKMVIAGITGSYVTDVFANYHDYSGISTLIGAFMYSIQIYADFSGYMDIVCGLCEILGIRLSENFIRPYFSKSIAEYWRRWHATLGAWFKTYIYYPIAVAKWNLNLGKKAKKSLGKRFGQTVPASIALVMVWLTTGLWHGASWAYIAWGGVNGLFIILSLWMEPVYESWKKKLKIRENTFLWRAFQTLRTFFLVTLIKVLPEVGTLSDGLGLIKRIFTNHQVPTGLHALLPFVHGKKAFLVAMGGVFLLFVTSLIQRKQPIRKWLNTHTNYIVRMGIFVGLTILIILFGMNADALTGGFLYAQF